MGEIKIGDKWFKAKSWHEEDGSYSVIWETWRAVRVTPKGAWFERVEFQRAQKFALAESCRWIRPTREAALKSLIARKVRQIEICAGQIDEAQAAIEIARELLK